MSLFKIRKTLFPAQLNMQWTVLWNIYILLVIQVLANHVNLNSNNLEQTFHSELFANCPPGYSQPANSNWTSCYQVYTNHKTVKSAANQCKAANGSLASVPNSFVNSYLYYLATLVDATSIWLGSECFNGDLRTCMNSDATPFGYNNFKPGQPDPLGTCVFMSAIGRDNQYWATFDCEQKFAFACEVAASTPPPEKPLSCPPGYDEYQNTGMCYKYVDAPYITPYVASLACQNITGGNLATIGSDGLNQFLKSKITSEDDDWLSFGLQCNDVKFDGDQSSCKWNDGTPYGWNAFRPNFPSHTSNGYCAFSNGTWTNCLSEDDPEWNAHFCQAPKQAI